MFSIKDISNDFHAEAILYTTEYWASISQAINYDLLKKIEANPFASIPDDKVYEAHFLMKLIKEHENNNED